MSSSGCSGSSGSISNDLTRSLPLGAGGLGGGLPVHVAGFGTGPLTELPFGYCTNTTLSKSMFFTAAAMEASVLRLVRLVERVMLLVIAFASS
jgi:hypothetical protein